MPTGFRKFVFSLVVVVVATALLLTHTINQENFVSIVKWVTAAFMGSNAIAKFGKRGG